MGNGNRAQTIYRVGTLPKDARNPDVRAPCPRRSTGRCRASVVRPVHELASSYRPRWFLLVHRAMTSVAFSTEAAAKPQKTPIAVGNTTPSKTRSAMRKATRETPTKAIRETTTAKTLLPIFPPPARHALPGSGTPGWAAFRVALAGRSRREDILPRVMYRRNLARLGRGGSGASRASQPARMIGHVEPGAESTS